VVEPPVDLEQLGELVEQRAVERLAGFSDVMGQLDVRQRGDRRQQVELLEDEADLRAA